MPAPTQRMLLFIVTGDPRTSGKPAEAIRIAAGVSVWQQVGLRLYLRGPAVLALSDSPDEFVDADHYTRYLPLLRESNVPIYVERAAAMLPARERANAPFQEITDRELAEMAAASHYVACF